MAGAPLQVVAANLGHADMRMTEKHYAHLAPSYVADVIRATMPRRGLVEPNTVVQLASGRTGDWPKGGAVSYAPGSIEWQEEQRRRQAQARQEP